MTPYIAVKKIIKLLGGFSKAASACKECKLPNGKPAKISASHTWNWQHRERRVPANCVILIERATHCSVTRYDMRPDVFLQEQKS